MKTEAFVTSAEVVNKNGARGVFTFTSDDGDPRTADFLFTRVAPNYPAFKITIGIPTKKVASLSLTEDGKAWQIDENGKYALSILKNEYRSSIPGSVFSGDEFDTTVDFWRKIAECKAIELASHSHTHAAWGLTDEYNPPYPAGNVIKELHASAQIVRELLGQDSPFILRPGGHSDLTSEYFYNLVGNDNTYIGMRGGSGPPPLPGAEIPLYAKLNTHVRFQEPIHRLRITAIDVRGYEAAFGNNEKGYSNLAGDSSADCIAAGISAWKQYVDYALSFGGWASVCFHSIVPDSTATAHGYAVFDSQFIALVEYLQPLADAGEIWLAPFASAAKYFIEWSSAEVRARVCDDGRIELTLTDNETDPRFDEPLTVRITVPNDWTSARLDSYGKVTELKVQLASDGSRFVYADVIPGSEISRLSAC